MPPHCDVLPIDTLLGPAAAASTRSSLPAIKSSKFGPAASLSAREPLLLLDDAAAAAVLLAPDELADEAAVARLRVRSCVCGLMDIEGQLDLYTPHLSRNEDAPCSCWLLLSAAWCMSSLNQWCRWY